MRKLISTVLIFLVFIARGASAQEVAARDGDLSRPIEIEEVKVPAGSRLPDIGTQKTVMDSVALRDNITSNLADVISHNSSVFIKSYGRATLSTASFRGTAPSHTQVLWNGMKLNSPMLGMVDFSLIPSYLIDAMSLYHGASSVGVTGGGLGGAITLSTRPEQVDGFAARYIQGIGSFSTYDEFLDLSYGGKRWHGTTRVSYSSSDNDFTYTNYNKKNYIYDQAGNITGFTYPRESNRNGDFSDFHILQDLSLQSRRGDRWSLSAWYMRSLRGVPMLSVDYSDPGRSRGEQRERTLRAVAGWNRQKDSYKLDLKAGYTYTDLRYTYTADPGSGQVSDLINSQGYVNSFFSRAEGEYFIADKWMFSGNISFTQDHVRSIDNEAPTTTAGPYIKGYDWARTELSGFASVRYKPTERWGITLNLREEVYASDFTPLIPALLAEYTLSKRGEVVLKASAARNYRYPSLTDLYFMPGGNPDLQPEDGYMYDGGIGFTIGKRESRFRFHGEAAGFDSYINNWILWLPAVQGTFQGVWSPMNVRRVHSYGLEAKADMTWNMGSGWELYLAGVFGITHSTNHGDPMSYGDESVGKQLVYIPVYSSAVTGRLSWKKWILTYKWNYYSERFTTSSNEPTRVGLLTPYYMNDVSLEKKLGLRFADLSFKVSVNNLFDEEYVSVLSHPMAGRNFGLYIEIAPRFKRR